MFEAYFAELSKDEEEEPQAILDDHAKQNSMNPKASPQIRRLIQFFAKGYCGIFRILRTELSFEFVMWKNATCGFET